MASQKLVNLLRDGGAYLWDQWRHTHPTDIPDLRGANLAGLSLDKCNLSQVDLSEANLSEARLWGSNFTGAKLIDANLTGANFAGTHLLGADLTGADLRRAYFRKADLAQANLAHASFEGASFEGANLSYAFLPYANLQNVNLSEANLNSTNLGKANLTGADLSGSLLVRTNLIGATLTHCRIYGVGVWDAILAHAKQDNLIITPPYEPTITIDDLEVAQFIYLLLEHQKIRNVLNAVTERGVLLLGRFGGGGLEMLQAVAAKLREEKYLPIIFDFDRPQDRNYTETVKTLAGLSRFIIADLSGPSVPQELYATVPHFKIPFVPILEAGRKQFAMAVDLLEYPWVIRPPVIFTSTDELVSLVPSRIIAPAEERHQARQQLLDELFHDV